MATLTLTLNSENRYNINGGSWSEPYGSSAPPRIMAGKSSDGTIYRAYVKVPVPVALQGQKITDITLNFSIKKYTSKWDIGLMDSQPSTGVTYSTDGFERIKADLRSSSTVSFSISASTWGATWGNGSSAKYIVFVYSQASTSGGYAEIASSSAEGFPSITFTYEPIAQKLNKPSLDFSVNSGSVISDYPVVKPGGKINLNWSYTHGTDKGQTFSRYRIQQSINDGIWSDYTTITNLNTVEQVFTCSTTITRGVPIHFRIRAEGSAGSTYYSDYSDTISVWVNDKPKVSIQSTNPTIVSSTGGIVSIKVGYVDLLGSEKILTYYTNLDSTRHTISASSSPATFSPTVGTQNTTFYIQLYDGLEYSDAASTTITVNSKPIINIVSNPNILSGNSPTSLVRTGSFSFTQISGTATSYSWYIQVGSTNTLVGQEQNLSNFDFSSYVSVGNSYKVGVRVSDSIESSDISWSNSYYMPYLPQAVSNINFYNSSTANNISGANTNQFNGTLTATYTNPSITTGYCDIKKTCVIYKTDTGSIIEGGIGGTTVSGSLTSITYSVPENTLSRGTSVQVGIRLIDSGNYYIDTWSTTYQLADLPILSGNGTINIGVVRPYTGISDAQITLPEIFGDNSPTYSIWAIVNEKNLRIDLVENNIGVVVTSTIQGDESSAGTIVLNRDDSDVINSFTINAQGLRVFFGNSNLNWNTNYTINFYAAVKDAFGNYSNTVQLNTAVVDLIFQEAPYFNSSDKISFRIYHGKDSNGNDIFSTPTTTSTRMYHRGEKIEFSIPQASDYNNNSASSYNDVTSYTIYVARLDSAPSSTNPSTADSNYVLLTSFNVEDATLSNGKIIYRYPIVNDSQMQFTIFKVTAQDSKGLISSSAVYSSTYLIRSRRAEPSLVITTGTVDTTTLTVGVNITDIGANNNYASYPNFERAISGYVPNSVLTVEYCLDGNFNNTSSTNYGTITSVTSSSFDSLIKIHNLTTNLSSNFQNKKLYIRAKLIITTGLSDVAGVQATVSNISTIFIYQADIPTISTRKNHLGVNNNTFNDDDILVVGDFGDRTYVRFVGTTVDGTIELTINLKTAEIDGAKISGGSW